MTVFLIILGTVYAVTVIGLFTRHLLWERWSGDDDDDPEARKRSDRRG